MNFNFKWYCKMMLCVIIAVIIVLSLPTLFCVLLSSLNIAKWAIVSISVISVFPTIYCAIKFIFFYINKFNMV